MNDLPASFVSWRNTRDFQPLFCAFDLHHLPFCFHSLAKKMPPPMHFGQGSGYHPLRSHFSQASGKHASHLTGIFFVPKQNEQISLFFRRAVKAEFSFLLKDGFKMRNFFVEFLNFFFAVLFQDTSSLKDTDFLKNIFKILPH